jgi:AcrR family transcriptional regulator
MSARPSRKSAKSAARMRKPERKQQLLTLAKQLFVSFGYHNTTTEKIAAAAGVSEPVLYRHFESKKALFLEVLAEIRQATLLRWQAESAHLTNPAEKLRAVIDVYLGATREHPLELRVMHRTLLEADDAEIAATLRAFYLETETLLAKTISEGQWIGVFRSSFDPRVAAWELIRSAMGYSLTETLNIPLYREPEYIPHAIDFLFRSMLASECRG